MGSSSGEVDDMRGIFSALCRQLTAAREISFASDEFRALNSNSDRTRFAGNLLEEFQLYPKLSHSGKSGSSSVEYRQKGNALFAQKKDQQALEMYSRSVALAEGNSDSEALGLAYANRSAVLCERKLYRQCLQDIERALLNNYPKRLEEKLLERRRKVTNLMKAENPSAKDQDKNVSFNKSDNYYDDVPALSSLPNQLIECAGSSVEIKRSPELGRHVVATEEINPGDVIAVERPFITILLPDNYYTHCYHCLNACCNLVPCLNCSRAMFCEENCRDIAWNDYHRYECSILSTLISLNVGKLDLLALKVVLCARNKLQTLMEENSVNWKDNKIDEDIVSMYKSARYEEIHWLIANTDKRTVADLFERAVTSSVICKLLQEHTTFFKNGYATEDENKMKYLVGGLLLRHLQTAPSNMHEISELFDEHGNDFKSVEIGAGAYSFLSLLNHECSPNVLRNCHGTAIVLRALRTIKKGEQIFDNYGYHHAVMDKEERQQHLSKQYHFVCVCKACVYNWPSFHQLTRIEVPTVIDVTEMELKILKSGDRTIARNITQRLINNIKMLESYVNKDQTRVPCKNFYENQEILKQCYAISGNKRCPL